MVVPARVTHTGSNQNAREPVPSYKCTMPECQPRGQCQSLHSVYTLLAAVIKHGGTGELKQQKLMFLQFRRLEV